MCLLREVYDTHSKPICYLKSLKAYRKYLQRFLRTPEDQKTRFFFFRFRSKMWNPFAQNFNTLPPKQVEQSGKSREYSLG